jgi:hypothetical protein
VYAHKGFCEGKLPWSLAKEPAGNSIIG